VMQDSANHKVMGVLKGVNTVSPVL